MEQQIAKAVDCYESGRISRRELVGYLTSLAIAFGVAGKPAAGGGASTFEAVGLNHIALRVTDVPRSRDFYVKHLGLTVTSEDGERNCFLDCGNQFVALFRSDTAGMDHYCYSIKNFDLGVAEEKLLGQGLKPRVHRQGGRIYFDDPDGLEVQLASTTHGVSRS
jgi:catechol 2,3-dioxygenase-like lactoylglutathione lyase family enzyme